MELWKLKLLAISACTILCTSCGDNEARCPTQAIPQDPVCLASLKFAARDSVELIPTQAEARRYFDRWSRAVEAEPILLGMDPQSYRNYTPTSITIWTSNPVIIRSWTRGELVTGDSEFDQTIHELVSPSLNSFWHDNGDGTYYFLLHVGAFFNEELLEEALEQSDAWQRPPALHPGDDGTWLWEDEPPGSDGTDDATADVEFTFGWGDCLVACDGYHTVKAVVPADGPARVFDLGGDPLPPGWHLSPNTKPPS